MNAYAGVLRPDGHGNLIGEFVDQCGSIVHVIGRIIRDDDPRVECTGSVTVAPDLALPGEPGWIDRAPVAPAWKPKERGRR